MNATQRVLKVLSGHIGALAGIKAGQLAEATGLPERRVRACISELREDGVAICGHPTTGYYIAQTAEELDRCCQFLRARAMHSLTIESRLRRIPLPDLIGQIKLPT